MALFGVAFVTTVAYSFDVLLRFFYFIARGVYPHNQFFLDCTEIDDSIYLPFEDSQNVNLAYSQLIGCSDK